MGWDVRVFLTRPSGKPLALKTFLRRSSSGYIDVLLQICRALSHIDLSNPVVVLW